MRFQGENCTLSFGMYFEKGQVTLNGTLWLRRSLELMSRQEQPRLRFNNLFSETDIQHLQEWLDSGSAEPMPIPAPFRRISRLSGPNDDLIRLELELQSDQVPSWWDWEISFPLRVVLEISPNEFTYLTRSLSRDYWSANLTW